MIEFNRENLSVSSATGTITLNFVEFVFLLRLYQAQQAGMLQSRFVYAENPQEIEQFIDLCRGL